jgi:bifunctional non-homologous end joining protein LigD
VVGKRAPRKAKTPASRLKTYREKRDFSRTAEPKPKLGRKKGWQFVVQKHDARRLHFDLRLELDGVLKSWAVTRGPSLVPEEKRLAVQTEDHPMDYLEWEGVIPKGEYGGGTMIVWDRGTWTPVFDPHFGLQKGHLEFTLDGSRLMGRWHLVRMARKSGEKKDPWLLIKGKDEFARTANEPEIVEQEMTSYLSGRTNDELATAQTLRADHAARAKVKRTKLPDPAKLPGAKKGILPVFVEPSLAAVGAAAPSGERWLHEIKYDGYRIQARIDGGKAQLLTRKGLDWTVRFPTVAAALKRLPIGSALIDGEIVVQDENGLASFAGLQSDLKSGRKDRMIYMAFDLLYLEGVDLRGSTLKHRKAALKAIVDTLPGDSIVRFSDHLDGDGETVLAHACKLGLEGIISKRTDLGYRSGRGEHWLKAKCVLGQEFVVLGYVPSTAAGNAIGSLVVGYYEKGKLVHAGRAGTGFSEEESVRLRKDLDKIKATRPAFAAKLPAGAEKGVKWVEPIRVAEVEYRGWGSEGLLRQASYRGMREDRLASEIELEQKPRAAPANRPRPAPAVKLTHPERILWGEKGITKQGLADFYTDIAEWILPHLVARPLSLVRCPSGVDGQCFYAKHAWQGASGDIRHVDVGDDEERLAIDDLKGLLSLVQASVLEIHPWGSRLDDLERPDRIIFDLDPGEDVAWQAVIAAAAEVRDRLKDRGLTSFVKTTGGKGLHVIAPLVPKADWERAKEFTRVIAEQMAADSPAFYVAKMTKAIRQGKIFVDFFRNGREATAVAAYSTRARKSAAVSTPLAWSELSEAITADHFTVDNLHQRLDFLKRDPWREFFKIKQKLP